MKSVRMPTKGGGEWWIGVHDLTVEDGRLSTTRPIHTLTFLCRFLVNHDKVGVYQEALALEAKLVAVRFQHDNLAATIPAVIDNCSANLYVRDSTKLIEVGSALEAYLGAIYGALELVARLSHRFDNQLPLHFRKLAKRVPVFSTAWDNWLARFFDMRSELTHFTWPFVALEEGKVIMEFHGEREREHYTKGRHEISFAELFGYKSQLFEMLDAWSWAFLQKVPSRKLVEVVTQPTIKSKLIPKKRRTSTIIRLLGPRESS